MQMNYEKRFRILPVGFHEKLRPIQSKRNNDPKATWEEDGAKIRLLMEILRQLNSECQIGLEARRYIETLLEVLRWKRCDLGMLLLHGRPSKLKEIGLRARGTKPYRSKATQMLPLRMKALTLSTY